MEGRARAKTLRVRVRGPRSLRVGKPWRWAANRSRISRLVRSMDRSLDSWSDKKEPHDGEAWWAGGTHRGHTVDLNHPTVVDASAFRQSRRRWPDSGTLEPGGVGERRARALQRMATGLASEALQGAIGSLVGQGAGAAAGHRVRALARVFKSQRYGAGYGRLAVGTIHGDDLRGGVTV